ncbi:MAG: hypothetical protein LBB22_05125 [Treponema sp.]|jgi:hypothetical protein|nr:hypothetical protein [Treponema sp.]
MNKILSMLVIIAYFNAAVWGVDYTWIGTASNNWDDSGNWNPGTGYPGSSDKATIAGTVAIITTGPTASVGTLEITGMAAVGIAGGTFTNIDVNNGATLTANGDISAATVNNSGTFILGSGVLGVTGDLTVAGTLTGGSGNISVGGALTIAAGGVFTASSGTTAVGGNWNNSGIFSHSNGTVNFTTGTHEVTGDNTFYIITATTSGSELRFEGGKTQTITNSIILDGGTLKSTDTTQFIFDVDTATVNITNTVISDAYSTKYIGGTVGDPINNNTDNGNNINFFVGYVWSGLSGSDTDWNTAGNWYSNIVPDTATPKVIIPYAINQPTTTSDITVPVLEIGSAAALTMGNHNLTVTAVGGFSMNDSATLVLDGVSGQTVTLSPAGEISTGTVKYTSANTGLAGINKFKNIVITAGAREATFAITANGSLSIESGASLAMDENDLTALAYSNEGTLILTGSETLSFPQDTNSGLTQFNDSAGAGLSGLTSFYDITIVNGGNRIATGTLDIKGSLNLNGGSLTLAGNASVAGSAGIAASTYLNIGGNTFIVSGMLGNFEPEGVINSSGGSIIISEKLFTQKSTGVLTGNGISIKAKGGISATESANSIAGNISLEDTDGGVIAFVTNPSPSAGIAITKAVSADGDINISNYGGGITSSAVVEAKNLTLTGSGAIAFTGANEVTGSVSLSGSNGVKYNSVNDLTVTKAVNDISGNLEITAAGKVINLNTGGSITSVSGEVKIEASSIKLFEDTLILSGGNMNINSNVDGLNAGSQSIKFNAGTSTITLTGNAGNAIALKEFAALSNIEKNGDLTIAAGTITLGSGGGGSISVSAYDNKNITLKTDGLYSENSGNSINAGTGIVTFAPYTNGKTIEFGDTDSSSSDIYYSSNFSNLTAGGVAIGNSSSGTLSVSGVAGAKYKLTLESASDIVFTGNYTNSAHKALTINAGGEMVTDVSATSPITIDIGTDAANSKLTVNSKIRLEQNLEIKADGGIIFNKDVYSSPGGQLDLTLNTLNNDIVFGGTVGSLSFMELGSLSIGTKSRVEGTGAAGVMVYAGYMGLSPDGVEIDSGGKNIILRLDGLINKGATVDAGAGTFTLSPLTANKTVEYGDGNTGVSNIYYQSLWKGITAASYIVGSEATGKISVSKTGYDTGVFGGTGVSYPMTLQNDENADIEIVGEYQSAGKYLTLRIGTAAAAAGTVSGNGVIEVSAGKISLGGGAFNAQRNGNLNVSVSVNAEGGIVFKGNLNVAASGKNLSMNAGAANILMAGAVGNSTGKLGAITVGTDASYGTGASNVTFGGDVYSSGDVNIKHRGTLSILGNIDAEGGFHQNSGIAAAGTAGVKAAHVRVGSESKDYDRDFKIETKSTSSIIFYNDIIVFNDLTLNETAGGKIETKNIYAHYSTYYTPNDRAWNLTVQSETASPGDIKISGSIGIKDDTATLIGLKTDAFGNVTLNGDKVTNTSIYSKTDTQTNTSGSVAVKTNSDWALSPSNGESVIVIQTAGGSITQTGAASNNVTFTKSVIMSSGETGGYASKAAPISIASKIERGTAARTDLSFITLGKVEITSAGAGSFPIVGTITVNGAGTFTLTSTNSADGVYAANLVFNGKTNTIFDSSKGDTPISNVEIDHDTGTGIILTKDVFQSGTVPLLNIKRGFLDLAAVSTNWRMADNSGTGFYAKTGEIRAQSEAAEIRTAGDFVVESGVTTTNVGSLSITMSGGAGTSSATSINIGKPSEFLFKNFKLISTDQLGPGGSATMTSKGWVKAESDLYLTGNWTVPLTDTDKAQYSNLNDSYQHFRPGTYSVNFVPTTGGTASISGDTLWYDLNIDNTTKKAENFWIEFAGYPHIHRVVNKFLANGGKTASNQRVNITRIGHTPAPPPPQPGDTNWSDQAPNWDDINKGVYVPDDNGGFFWILNKDGAYADTANLNIWYNYVTPDSIPLNQSVTAPWGFPRGGDQIAHYCRNWRDDAGFIYSFTEDVFNRNGKKGPNGRIDRIRLQAPGPMNADFSDFSLEIEGYKLNTNMGDKGYQLSPSEDMVFIFLQENDMPDTGAMPKLNLENTSLKLKYPPLGSDGIITIPERSDHMGYYLIPVDTAPPRIAYSLAVPGEKQVYIRFTEPVNSTTLPTTGAFGNNTIDGAPIPLPKGTGSVYAQEYLIPLNGSYSANEIMNGITYDESIFESVMDVPPDPPTWPEPLGSTYYPTDYDYGDYKTIDTGGAAFPQGLKTGGLNIWQPNTFRMGAYGTWGDPDNPEGPVTSVPHRVSDLLVMVKPENANDTKLSLWPLFVRDIAGMKDVRPGMATVYDGSETIRNTDLYVGNINAPNITLDLPPQISFGFDISGNYKEQPADGLWLPKTEPPTPRQEGAQFYPPPYINMVTKAYEIEIDKLNSAMTPSGTPEEGQYPYPITLPEKGLMPEKLLEFIYILLNPSESKGLGPLYGVRINGGWRDDWYNNLATFKIKIRDIVYQRSGATILSNVINPTKGEKAVLNYELTRDGPVTVQVFTLDGVLVQTLYRGSRPAGEYVEAWDGKNNGGNIVARGMYFIRIVAPDIDEIRKVMVVK